MLCTLNCTSCQGKRSQKACNKAFIPWPRTEGGLCAARFPGPWSDRVPIMLMQYNPIIPVVSIFFSIIPIYPQYSPIISPSRSCQKLVLFVLVASYSVEEYAFRIPYEGVRVVVAGFKNATLRTTSPAKRHSESWPTFGRCQLARPASQALPACLRRWLLSNALFFRRCFLPTTAQQRHVKAPVPRQSHPTSHKARSLMTQKRCRLQIHPPTSKRDLGQPSAGSDSPDGGSDMRWRPKNIAGLARSSGNRGFVAERLVMPQFSATDPMTTPLQHPRSAITRHEAPQQRSVTEVSAQHRCR